MFGRSSHPSRRSHRLRPRLSFLVELVQVLLAALLVEFSSTPVEVLTMFQPAQLSPGAGA